MMENLNVKLYHYTTLDNLALILKHRTLRFNRLDMVDDMEDAETYCQTAVAKGKYTFVSC